MRLRESGMTGGEAARIRDDGRAPLISRWILHFIATIVQLTAWYVTFSSNDPSKYAWVNKMPIKTFSTQQAKVKMMKKLPTVRTIRNTIISVAAVSAMALPLFASASSSSDASGAVGIVYSKTDLASSSQEDLYAKLQSASRKMCGSSRITATGSLRRSIGNQECYEGTLTAAVDRLDNAEVSALHNQ